MKRIIHTAAASTFRPACVLFVFPSSISFLVRAALPASAVAWEPGTGIGLKEQHSSSRGPQGHGPK